MRRAVRRALTLGLLVLAPALAHAQLEPLTVEDGSYLRLDALAKAAGFATERHADPRRITVTAGSRHAELTLGDRFVQLEGGMLELPAAPRLVNGEVLVPVESVSPLAAALGLTFRWVVRPPMATAPSRSSPLADPGPRRARVLVIDPGHGGSDIGTRDGELVEKDLTLAVARRVAARLQGAGVQVVLTRGADRTVPLADRASIANRARPAAVLSLHVGAFPSLNARGVLLWSPPAAAGTDGDRLLREWDAAAGAHADRAEALADSLASAFDRAGLGPSHVRQRLPVALVGVDAPAVLLELGSLASPAERGRLADAAGLDRIADTIAQGVRAWGRW